MCIIHSNFTGVKVTVKGEEVMCKAWLLFTLAYLPAKAFFTNMMHFNEKFECPTCKLEGEHVVLCDMVSCSYTDLYAHRFSLEEAELEHMDTTQLY